MALAAVAPDLTFHPQAELVLRRHEGEVVAVTVAAPVRGRPLQVITFSQDREPAIVDLLRRVAAGRGDVEVDLDESDWARLAEAGLLLPQDRVPVVPRFDCPPCDPPRHLVPRRARRLAPLSSERLHVSAGLRYQDEVRLPDEGWAPRQTLPAITHRGDVNPFAEGCAWAWVEHPDAAVPSILSIHEADRDLFRRLRPGDPEPDGLDAELRDALATAGVLVDPKDVARRREAWARTREMAAAHLARDAYAAVSGLLHPVQIAALRRYYRALIAEGHARLRSPDDSLRYWVHNEPLARYFHQRLAGLVTELSGAPMQPSYVLFSSYQPGATLVPHRDREQCGVTISLLIDYEPDPDEVSPWPLWLGLDPDEQGAATRQMPIALGLGDGLFYRGTELLHWRQALTDGHTSSSLLLHYVPAEFTGRLD